MKIQKGHYVPKELITSEAVHEAVVKCFVAAGFNKIGYCNYGSDIGAGVLGVSTRVAGGIIENPLTLQQLFTAENGLQWPGWADSVCTDGDCVWFSGIDIKVISGNFNHKSAINTLAVRQPKEREVKTIEDAVIYHNGIWPVADGGFLVYHKKEDEYSVSYDACIHTHAEQVVCNGQEFESAAKHLGYINGYRWGVEYPTNGKQPELADDVLVELRYSEGGIWFDKIFVDSRWMVGEVVSFRITDQRYKPADTSYLNAQPQDQSLTHSEEGLTHSWHERGELPPVGWFGEINFGPYSTWCECVALPDGFFSILTTDGWSVFDKTRVLEPKFRPIRTEREKFSDDAEAVFKATGFDKLTDWGFLYDAGFRGPKVEK